MLVNQLFHIAIKSPNVEATRRFYMDVLGMTLAQRPQFDFPGVWLQAAVPGGQALFHVYGGSAALESDGSMASGTGVIDHVAITVHGFADTRRRVQQYGLAYRENKVPGVGLWQLFVHDPSAVLLELSYLAVAEDLPDFEIPAGLQYRPGERFFNSENYRQFHG
jgi:catechol 2,3-dioxygenase-like lactoylglutathione lyase family enzyme